MRYRVISNWINPNDSENILYFAQLIDELLFDFSLDTYKPSAMNSSLLCKEALDTYAEIEMGNIKRPNFQHVLDELCLNIEKDKVAASMLQVDLRTITPVLKSPKEDFHDKRIVVELLARQLDLLKYKDINEKMLAAVIEDANSSKSDIRQLTRSYITCLVNLGYSSKYMEQKALQFFYYGENKIVGNSDVRKFVELFPSNSKEYLVVYRSSARLMSLDKSLEKRDIYLCNDSVDIGFDISKSGFEVGADEVYAVVKNIEAIDVISAQNLADKEIEIVNTLYSLFHHKEGLNLLGQSLVIDKKSGDVFPSKKITNAMHKCSDLTPSRAAIKLNQFIAEFSLKASSFSKFTRSAELHALALASDSIENQIINLWIAMESIIPSKPEERDISNIEHIIKSITPFLSIGYLDRLIAKFTRDASNWNSQIVRKTLKSIEGDDLTMKMANLMALPQYQDAAREFSSKFRDFHLLEDRFKHFCELLSSPKNVSDVLHRHNQRIAWQVRRIYRARNLIVHSGKTPSYTEILIENTHDYLDIIMGTLMKLAILPKKIASIEQGFMYADLSYRSMMSFLGEKGVNFDDGRMGRVIGKHVI